MLKISSKDGSIVIKGTDVCGVMPTLQSAKYYAREQAWVMPGSPASAFTVYKVFADVSLNNKEFSDDVTELVRTHLDSMSIRQGVKGFDSDFKSIKTKPWAHQTLGIGYALSQPSTMLAMEMGTGKSLCAVAVAGEIDARLVLVLCPKSVVKVWPKQFDIHSNLDWTVLKLEGSTVRKTGMLMNCIEHQLRFKNRLVVVCNYDSCWRDPLWRELQGVLFDLLILDESQRIKSHNGKASKFVGASLARIPKKLALSGTPASHSPLDLFGQYRTLEPGIFGQHITKFRRRYCVIGPAGPSHIIGWQNENELNQRYNSIAYTVKKKDCLDLPEEVDEIELIELSAKNIKFYKQMESDFYIKVDNKEVTASNAMTKMLRLQQITSGFCKTEDDEEIVLGDDKLTALKQILEDIPRETKITIFCRFRKDIQAIRAVVSKLGRSSGELSGQANDLTVDATYPPEHDVLVVQIQSGGVGIDLSLSSVAIYFSLGLSLGDYLQSKSRLHRPGQLNKVTYIHMLAQGTIDIKIYNALLKREKFINYILEHNQPEEVVLPGSDND